MIHTHSYIAYLLLDISKYATLDYIHPYMGTYRTRHMGTYMEFNKKKQKKKFISFLNSAAKVCFIFFKETYKLRLGMEVKKGSEYCLAVIINCSITINLL